LTTISAVAWPSKPRHSADGLEEITTHFTPETLLCWHRRLAALLDVPLVEAAKNVIPVAKTAGEAVEKLRTWASGRCLSADRPGIYTSPSQSTIKPGRKVSRDPLNN